MRNSIKVLDVKDNVAVVQIKTKQYHIDFTDDSLLTVHQNGKLISGSLDSDWIYTQTDGTCTATTLRVVIDEHVRVTQEMASKIYDLIRSNEFIDNMWPLFYPNNYCVSYLNSMVEKPNQTQEQIIAMMCLRNDCSMEITDHIRDLVGYVFTNPVEKSIKETLERLLKNG